MIASRHLNTDERLVILRAADQYRRWNSLDDRRCCILCDRQFSGRQVEITCRDDGTYDLNCPTEGCKSLPRQWVYPGNPLTSETVYVDWLRALGGKPALLVSPRTTFSRAQKTFL